jgi:transposase
MRQRILQLHERGKVTREIAQFLGFCVAAVRRVRHQFRQRGTLQPRTHLSGRRTLLTKERKQRLHQLRSARPDATLAESGAGKSSAVTIQDRKPICSWLPKRPSKPSRSSTARISFLAPNTLHDLWKCSSLPPASPCRGHNYGVKWIIV